MKIPSHLGFGVKWPMTRRSEYASEWLSWKEKNRKEKWSAISYIAYYTKGNNLTSRWLQSHGNWGSRIYEETPYGRSAAATILPSSFNMLKVDAALRCQEKRWDKGKHSEHNEQQQQNLGWDTQDNHFTESITSNFMPVDRMKRLSSGSSGSICLPHPINKISEEKKLQENVRIDRNNWISKLYYNTNKAMTHTHTKKEKEKKEFACILVGPIKSSLAIGFYCNKICTIYSH